MPVVFEQPDPVGFETGAAQAGGYVQQYNANRQYALQAAALQQHAQQANQQAQTQRILGEASIQQQGQALAARGQVSPAELFAARQQQQVQGNQFAQQEALLAQRFGQQQQMEQQAAQQAPATFSQGDYLQLQRLQNGNSELDRQLAGGTITPEEAQQQRQQITPQLEALRQKQQQYRGVQRRQAADDAMHQTAAQTSVMLMNDSLIAKAAGATDGSNRIPVDPSDPSKGHAGVIIAGKFHAFSAGAVKAAAGEEESKLELEHQKQDGKDYTELFKAMSTKGTDGSEKTADPEAVKAALYERRKFVQAGIDARKATKAGLPAPKEPGEGSSENALLPKMADPKAEAAAYQSKYEGKAVPAEVLMRLRELRAQIQAQTTPPSTPPVAQAATRQPPQPGFMDNLRGLLPSGGNVGGVGRDPRYR